MELVLATIDYKEQYLEALEEAKNETGDTRLNKPESGESFEKFVQRLIDQSKGINLPEDYVPCSTFWLIDNNEFIGRVDIRHQLTEQLSKRGGNIGYYIRPSKRRLGYGKKILALALLEAKKLGLTKVLITCDNDNIGSQKIIESNGGALENIVELKESNLITRRYWIQL